MHGAVRFFIAAFVVASGAQAETCANGVCTPGQPVVGDNFVAGRERVARRRGGLFFRNRQFAGNQQPAGNGQFADNRQLTGNQQPAGNGQFADNGQLGGGGSFTGTANPQGFPSFRQIDFDRNRRPALARVFDALRTEIGRTTVFDVNGNPVFDPSTGLSSNGLVRVRAATGVQSQQQPTNQANPAPGVVPAAGETPEVRQINGINYIVQKGKPDRRVRVITTSQGNILEWQPDGSLKSVDAVRGDLIFEDENGRFIKFRKESRVALLAEYERTIQGYSGELRTLVEDVIARLKASMGTSTTPPPPNPQPPPPNPNPPPAAGDAHGGDTDGPAPPAPTTPTAPRPEDPNAASDWTKFKKAYENAAPKDRQALEALPEKIQQFVNNWQVPATRTAVMGLSCLSDRNPSEKAPMTLFLTKDQDPTTKSDVVKLRLDAGTQSSEDSVLTTLIEKSRDREIILKADWDAKALRASRDSIDLPGMGLDYDLRVVEGSVPPKYWVKVVASIGKQKYEYLCGEAKTISKKIERKPETEESRRAKRLANETTFEAVAKRLSEILDRRVEVSQIRDFNGVPGFVFAKERDRNALEALFQKLVPVRNAMGFDKNGLGLTGELGNVGFSGRSLLNYEEGVASADESVLSALQNHAQDWKNALQGVAELRTVPPPPLPGVPAADDLTSGKSSHAFSAASANSALSDGLAKCASCHGPEGKDDAAKDAMLLKGGEIFLRDGLTIDAVEKSLPRMLGKVAQDSGEAPADEEKTALKTWAQSLK